MTLPLSLSMWTMNLIYSYYISIVVVEDFEVPVTGNDNLVFLDSVTLGYRVLLSRLLNH
jgi:hypothetical protein